MKHTKPTPFRFLASLLVPTTLFLLATVKADDVAATPRVLLDNYYNHQEQNGKRFHYTWDDKANGGYDLFGALFNENGAKTDFLTNAPTTEALKGCSVYIIVNPNTPKNAVNGMPNYMTPEEASTIGEWVREGGTLLLFNNDKGNADFEHINILAKKFGITFNEDGRNAAPHHETNQMQIQTRGSQGSPILQGVSAVSMRGICSLSLQDPAKAILTAPKEKGEGTDVIMATCNFGKGRVFAVGDPWLYNEYIHNVNNFRAAANLVRWALGKSPDPHAESSESTAPRFDPLQIVYPKGCDPVTVGQKITEDLIARRHAKPDEKIGYPEGCVALGALEFCGLTKNQSLLKEVVGLYARDMTNQVQAHNTIQGCGVDNHAFAIIPLEIFLQTKDQAFLDGGTTLISDEWKVLQGNGLTSMSRYWIDDSFMVGTPLVLSIMATGDSVQKERLGKFLASYIEHLQQPNGLFYHGEAIPFFWGRGNGWGAVAMANALRVLKPGDPHYEEIMAGYRKMMATLLKYQELDGMWHQLIDHPESYEESSATGMFTYAMIVGVKEGWLDKATYWPAVQKGWIGLVHHLDKQYLLTDVCVGTGQKNDLSFYLERPRGTGDFHGHGPLIWCADALLR
jgi:unsaturated rhamnogalacturonyl hydrolase